MDAMPEFAAAAAQFGTAGLMGWMWLTERRASATRERQLTEAHEKLVQERGMFEAVIQALKENTRAIASLEAGQRSLAEALRTKPAGLSAA
jgi:hypothetical protein